MSGKKIKLLRKMAIWASTQRPGLRSKKVFANMKRLYKTLDAETRAKIKGLNFEDDK